MPVVSTSLSEGVTPSEAEAPTISTVTLTPLWYGSWVSYTDQLKLQAFDPVISEVSGILGEQAGLSFDTLVRNAMTDGATKDYAGAAAQRTDLDTTNDKIDYADFVGAVAALKIQNAMPGEGAMFPVVVHPLFSYAQ